MNTSWVTPFCRGSDGAATGTVVPSPVGAGAEVFMGGAVVSEAGAITGFFFRPRRTKMMTAIRSINTIAPLIGGSAAIKPLLLWPHVSAVGIGC